jgi:hypothetical protein
VRRSLKWLRRILVALVVLAIVAVAGFWWIAYSPFEGRVGEVVDLVPADVEFVYRGSWKEIRERGWVQQHLIDRPVLPELESLKDLRERSGLARVEDQIESGLPGIVKKARSVVFGADSFRVDRDLLAGEVVAAGRWCGGGSPQKGPPQWRELLLLTRVTSQVRFTVAALRHDFVRQRALPPDADLSMSVTDEGILRVELHDPALRSRRRETCEGGSEMAPVDVWYVLRVKDVLAVSNSEDLIRRTAEVAAGTGERAVDRQGFAMPPAEGGISAFVDLERLRSYFERFFSEGEGMQAFSTFVGKFLAVDSLDRATGRLVPLPSGDGALASAEVEYSPDRLRLFKDVEATYALTPRAVSEGIPSMLPAKDTIAVAELTTPPATLFKAIYENLSKDERRLVEERVREIGARRRESGDKGYSSVGEFLDELAAQLTTHTGVAISRISSVMDKTKYATWYLSDEPAPKPGFTVLVGIPAGRTPEEVDKFLSDRVAALGFRPPERVPYRGDPKVTYARLPLEIPKEDDSGSIRLADLELYNPAYFVGNGWLVLSTREEYLQQVISILRKEPDAPETVLASRGFDAAMHDLSPDATLAVYVEGNELRKYLWDLRNPSVRAAHPDDEHAKEFRLSLHEKARREGKAINLVAINDEVDKEMERWRREEYPRFVEKWRQQLERWRRFGGAGFVLAARQAVSRIDVGLSIVFAPP